MNFATLQTDVASWLQRDNLTAQIPTFIAYATAAFNRELRRRPLPEMEARDTTALVGEFTGLPGDFIRMRGLTRADGKEILYVTPQQMDDYRAAGYDPEPQIYTIEDMQLRVLPAPTPAAPVTVTMRYFEELAPLVSASDTNWLLTTNPDLYLMGALMQARSWLHDDARLKSVVEPTYNAELAKLRERVLTSPGLPSLLVTDVPRSIRSFDVVRGW
jgi:hypothetical protein